MNISDENQAYQAVYVKEEYKHDCQKLVQSRKLINNIQTHKLIINNSSIDLGPSLNNNDTTGGKYIDMTIYQRLNDVDKLFIPNKKPIVIDYLSAGQNILFFKKLQLKTTNKFIIVIDEDVYFQDLIGGVLRKWQFMQLKNQNLINVEYFTVQKKDLQHMSLGAENYHNVIIPSQATDANKSQLLRSLICASKLEQDKINKSEYTNILENILQQNNLQTIRQFPQYTSKHDVFQLLQNNLNASSSLLTLFQEIYKHYFRIYTNITAKFLLATFMSDAIISIDQIFDFMPSLFYIQALSSLFSLVSPLRETLSRQTQDPFYVNHKELNNNITHEYDVPRQLLNTMKYSNQIYYFDEEDSQEFSDIVN